MIYKFILLVSFTLLLLGYLAWTSFNPDPNKSVNNSVQEDQSVAPTESAQFTNTKIKRRNLNTGFQAPKPAPTDWKLNYGDDDDVGDDIEKQEVISGLQMIPDLAVTPSPFQADTLLVGVSPTPSAGTKVNETAEEANELFNDQELEQLEDQGAEVDRSNNLISGGRLDLKDDIGAISPSPTPSVEASPGSQVRYSGQARGYTLLALMHPAARAMAERQVEILINARLQRAFLSVLADGTFGIDYEYLQQVVRRINSSGTELILGIYFSNGPGMRVENEREWYRNLVNRYEPEEFREEIKTNQKLRQEFRQLFQQARSTFQLNQSLSPNNANIAYMMLEDNLDASSYQELRSIADEELAGVTNFIRNPCPGCYEGNDFDPGQDRLEFHLPDHMHALTAGDGYSMDGQSLFFPGEFDPSGLSVEDAKTIISAAQSQRLAYFGLWRAARQGITGSGRVPPDQRTYEVPSLEQEQIEIELLRYGLTAIDAEDQDFEDDEVVDY